MLMACQTTSQVDCSNVDYVNYIPADQGCLAISIINRKTADDNPTMMVFLEGDQYGSGSKNEFPGAISMPNAPQALLVDVTRPGYVNWRGDKSSGSAQWASMAPLSEAEKVGLALTNLKVHYNVSRLVIMGQSGGAAYAGSLMGLYPDLFDIGILLGCPCDMEMWHGNSRYRRMNPMNYVDRISDSATIVAITGKNDDNTFPRQVINYIETLHENGVTARYVEGNGSHSYYSNWYHVKRVIRLALGADLSKFDEFVRTGDL